MSRLSKRVDKIEQILTIIPKGNNQWESYELWKLNGRRRLLEINIERVNDYLKMLFDYLGVKIVEVPETPTIPASQKLQPRKPIKENKG